MATRKSSKSRPGRARGDAKGEPVVHSDGYMPRKYRNIVIAQKINAMNSRMGRPRRGWIVYTREGHLIGFVDENYGGRQALTSLFTKPTELREIYVTPKEYNEHMTRRLLGGY